MINREAGEADDVDDGGTMFLKVREQALDGALLVAPSKRKNHAPVPALEIALPCTTGPALEKFCVIAAEVAQVRVAGNHNFFVVAGGFARTSREDFSDEGSVVSRAGEGRIEFRVIEELARGAHHDEAMMGVGGR